MNFFLICFSTLLITILGAKQCRLSSDCFDNRECTIDFCEPKQFQCYNIATSSNCTAWRSLTQPQRLIKQVNKNQISASNFIQSLDIIASILHDYHPHRLLHLNLLKVDPVLEINSLRSQILSGNIPTNVQFHEQMITIFKKLNDFHTTYITPKPLNTSLAILPFAFQPYYEQFNSIPKYILTDVAQGITLRNPTFKKGVQIILWNGIPIYQQILKVAQDGYGANQPAKLANAVNDIRARLFRVDKIVRETSVTIGYITQDGITQSIVVDWLFVIQSSYSQQDMQTDDNNNDNNKNDQTSNTSRQQQQQQESSSTSSPATIPIPLNISFAPSLSAEIIPTSRGNIGRLVLFTFRVEPISQARAYLQEIARILRILPQDGLIVDVRANNGGNEVSEKVIELLTSKPFKYIQYTFRATKLIEQINNASFIPPTGSIPENADVRFPLRYEEKKSLRKSRLAGDPYVGIYPFVGSDRFPGPRLQSVYKGPYLILADGLTYSEAEVFTSIHKDHSLAPVVISGDRTGGRTGGGGATVIQYACSFPFLPLNNSLTSLSYPSNLPGGMDFTTADLRLIRTGKSRGAILENFGVKPDFTYLPTKNDRLNNDNDLYEFLAKILKPNANTTNV